MANETLRTNQAALIHTEIIAQQSIEDIAEELVVSQFVHHDSMDGAAAPKKDYPVESSLGVSAAGTEGTTISTNQVVGMGTTIAVTPAEGVLDAFVFSEMLVMERLGGASSVSVVDAFASEDRALLEALLRPDIPRIVQKGMRKIEADIRALLATATSSVGGVAETMTLDLFLGMVYKLRGLHPLRGPSEWVAVLNNKQLEELDRDMLTTGGGKGAALFSQQAQYTAGRPENADRGYWKHVLDYPVYGLQQNDRILAETDAEDDTLVGAFLVRGREDAPTSRPGWAVYAERQGLTHRFNHDIRLRGMELVQNAIYSQAILSQKNLVKVLTASGE